MWDAERRKFVGRKRINACQTSADNTEPSERGIAGQASSQRRLFPTNTRFLGLRGTKRRTTLRCKPIGPVAIARAQGYLPPSCWSKGWSGSRRAEDVLLGLTGVHSLSPMWKGTRMKEGVDYDSPRLCGPQLNQADIRFVCRYLSHDPSKKLSHEEVAELRSTGIEIVCVSERAACDPGRSRGHTRSTCKRMSAAMSCSICACTTGSGRDSAFRTATRCRAAGGLHLVCWSSTANQLRRWTRRACRELGGP